MHKPPVPAGYGFTCFVAIDRHSVALRQKSDSGDRRIYELIVDGVVRGEVALSPNYPPRISVGGNNIAIWNDSRLYIASIDQDSLKHFDQDDLIDVAYAIGRVWCLVCELSIAIFDPETSEDVFRFHHDEILLRSWWSDERLFVEDLRSRRLEFRLRILGHNHVTLEGPISGA